MSRWVLLGTTTADDHQLSFRDASLLATAWQADDTMFVSEDMQNGYRLGGVEIVNPFAPGAAGGMATVLDT